MIVVVLHEPQELANIAHVVRAMMNFGFADLRLVSPREFDAYRCEGIAHRSGAVLARTALFDDLDAALGDCVHVAGYSARERTARRSAQRPRDAAAEALGREAEGTVALLFGREDKGLSNDALDRCHRVVAIPSDPAYPSLNLGHAVAIALYELALGRGAEERPFKPPRRHAPAATAAQLAALHAEAETALRSIGFFKSHVEEQVLRTVREVCHRAALDEREAKLLRAMAIEVARRARGVDGRPTADG